nr:unnamed protein product [Callosobruchus chinensis]
MRIYSQQEIIDMILVLGSCEENCLIASRVYAQNIQKENILIGVHLRLYCKHFEQLEVLLQKSNEQIFHNNGLVNNNIHYYSDGNPHFYRTVDRQRQCLGWDNRIACDRPVLFRCSLKLCTVSSVYQKKSTGTSGRPAAKYWAKDMATTNGAPTHHQLNVCTELNRQYPNKWIGRGGPKYWQARSPDLSSRDFFKNNVYDRSPTIPGNMKERILIEHIHLVPKLFKHMFQA